MEWKGEVSQNMSITWSGRERCVRTWASRGVKGEVCQNMGITWSGRERCVRTWALGGVEGRGVSERVDIRRSGRERFVRMCGH